MALLLAGVLFVFFDSGDREPFFYFYLSCFVNHSVEKQYINILIIIN